MKMMATACARVGRTLLAAAMFCAAAENVKAQSATSSEKAFPARSIALVVPFPAGGPSDAVARAKMLVAEGKGNYGFNAQTHTYGDLVQMGVLDPTKVARTALQNAASVASLMLTTDAMVAELVEEKASKGGPGGGMGGMGGMGDMDM